MIIDRGTLNVGQYSISYLLNYFAFMSQEFIQEPLMEVESRLRGTVDPHAGYIGFTILWSVNSATSLFGGALVEKLTAKWSMLTGIVIYIIYQSSFLCITPIGLYSTSFLMGIGSMLLGIAQGKALAENSTKATSETNTAIMWTIFKISLIIGGIFLILTYQNQTLAESMENGDFPKMCILFIGLNIFGAINIALSPQPVYQVQKEKQTVCQTFLATTRLMCTKKMLFMTPIFLYLGFARSFWVAIYPTCIKFTSRLGGNTTLTLAYSCLATGVGQVLASIILSILGSRARAIGREYIYLFGVVIHIIIYVLVVLFFPYDASIHVTENVSYFEPNKYVAIGCSGFLGFGDAILQIEMQTFLVDGWSMESSHAYALCKFFGAAATCVMFLAAQWITLPMHLIMNSTIAILSAISAFIVQRKYFTNFKKDNLAGVEIRIDDDGSTIKHQK